MTTQQAGTVPSLTDRQREYRDYLRTPGWQEKRLAALERAGHRCQTCNGKQNLDVHHRTYERIFNEEPGDLTVLCRKCHELFHGAKKKPRRKPKAKRPKKSKGTRPQPILSA